MPRKKAKDQQNILSRPIIIKVTEAAFKRLDGIRKQSRQPTIGEVVRSVSAEEITGNYSSIKADIEDIFGRSSPRSIPLNQKTSSRLRARMNNHRSFRCN